ncbi:hypothetical protein GALMADRAFT_221797 [Galerina marginata CBS 339.88]|uniref:Uncharacterized protein n=1 Tax=Galerina marginata (strain CBS 339.88) TaxID=685588 RepID=A0A067TSI7_GALM3|nr:hypothetical protein GALMADRAFT_221797 [Galerina marginata CBS 339.88]
MSTNSNVHCLNLTTSSRTVRVIRPLVAPTPPCPDVRMAGHKPSTPLRVLTSASLRPNNPPTYVKETDERVINIDDIDTCTLSSDESSVQNGKIVIWRNIITSLKSMARKFRSVNLPFFTPTRL